jgi:hypothetical protein
VSRPDSTKVGAVTAESTASAKDTAKLRMAVNPVPSPVPAPQPPPKTATPKTFRGLYVRNENDSSSFTPCGDRRSYAVIGRGDALSRIRQHYRFTTVYIGRPLYAVLQGYFRDDTLQRPAAADTSRSPEVVRRFFVARLDTLRVRSERDCRGVRSASQ